MGGHNRVASLGNDEYHVEVALATDNKLCLLALGADEPCVQTVAAEPLPALLRGSGDAAAVEVTLATFPQPGDPPGTTSRFIVAVPPAIKTTPLELTSRTWRWKVSGSGLPLPWVPPTTPPRCRPK